MPGRKLSPSAEAFNERTLRKEAARCVHFNGIGLPSFADRSLDGDEKNCKAGVNYREHAGGDRTGWVLRLPCFGDGRDRDDAIPCPLFEATGMDRALAEKNRRDEDFERTIRARAAVVAHTEGKLSTAGAIKCPNCGGRLSYTVAFNGHIWGHCSTGGCAHWME